jgi:hypothetical protein
MKRLRNPLPLRAAVPLLVALAGCDGGGPRVVRVSGILTYKGDPVTNAYLQFLPEYGRQSWAQTDGQGRFTVRYDAHQDGAVTGRHKVWVEMRPSTVAEREAVMQGKAPPLSREMKEFFQKYSAENSKLTVEIAPGTRELKLELD